MSTPERCSECDNPRDHWRHDEHFCIENDRLFAFHTYTEEGIPASVVRNAYLSGRYRKGRPCTVKYGDAVWAGHIVATGYVFSMPHVTIQFPNGDVRCLPVGRVELVEGAA